MVRHIFKIIWNERKTNSWIILEYVLVFCILWFCCDYLYYIGKSYYEPLGFDINNTYSIRMVEKQPDEYPPDYEIKEITEDENYSYAMTLTERLKQYPGIEYVSLSSASMPYSNSSTYSSFLINSDTILQGFRKRYVSSEFFDVFRIKLTKGIVFDWNDPASKNQILISPDRNGYFGRTKISAYPASEVYKLAYKENLYTVIGVTEKLKSKFLERYENTIFSPS